MVLYCLKIFQSATARMDGGPTLSLLLGQEQITHVASLTFSNF